MALEVCGGGDGGGMEAQRSVPAPFLSKTYELVEDPATNHIVSWGEEKSTFVVWRPSEFARDILPSYFKHNNFSSFVRQLNTYGFRKIVPERWEFANDLFQKGEKHLLCEIHRRKTHSPHSPISHPSLPHPFHHYNVPSTVSYYHYGDPFSSSSPSLSSPPLAEDNERLRRANASLLLELSHMRRLYNDIIYFVQNHVQPVSPSSPILHSNRSPPQREVQKKVYNNWSNGSSRSSLTIAEEEDNEREPRLFGVSLGPGKRPAEWDESSSQGSKARVISRKELGLNLGPSCAC